MTTRLFALLALALPLASFAQETIPLERAQRGAKMANEALGTVADAPVRIDPDLDRPHGIGAAGVGALAVPDRAFSGDKISSLGESPTPLGQLWLLGMAPAQSGVAADREKLRHVSIQTDDNTLKPQVYFLALGKTADGKPELLIYGKDTEPLLRIPLQPATVNFQNSRLELTGSKDSDSSGRLTLFILGQHSAEFPVVKFSQSGGI